MNRKKKELEYIFTIEGEKTNNKTSRAGDGQTAYLSMFGT
jgi:hypothetical protein